MFTGIVEGLRRVALVETGEGWRRVVIDLGPSAEGVRPGDSIAVNGCCLTVERIVGSEAAFHAIGETLRVTALGSLAAGDQVNVERSLKVGDPLGGHFVTGHVDGIGIIVEKSRTPEHTWMTVELPTDLEDLAILKGSVTLDGVSLTIAGLVGRRLSVALIPHTLAITTLGTKSAGASVHLEMDQIGKWVKRLLQGVRA